MTPEARDLSKAQTVNRQDNDEYERSNEVANSAKKREPTTIKKGEGRKRRKIVAGQDFRVKKM